MASNSPKFGHRKIGRAAFELAKVRAKQTKKFGPRKFGAKKAALMAAELAEAEAKAAGVTAPAPTAPEGEAPTTSVKHMAIALGENVEHLDEFIGLEKARPGGLRKTAIKLFLGTELAKEENARDEVIAELQDLLKQA